MAKESITKQVLLNAYKVNGIKGIKILLSMSVNKKVRVTSNTKIIDKICDIIKTNSD